MMTCVEGRGGGGERAHGGARAVRGCLGAHRERLAHGNLPPGERVSILFGAMTSRDQARVVESSQASGAGPEPCRDPASDGSLPAG